MKIAIISLTGAAAILVMGSALTMGKSASDGKLKPVSAFADIADKNERAVALFEEAGKVIQHPRCVNCHPAGDRPLQGDDSHLHQPLVVRGVDNFGAIGMRCTTCHGSKNFDPGRVPGNPRWHLAPLEMAWAGKSLSEICTQIKDQERNGGMTMDQLVHHMAEDDLVGWAWNPDAGRQPAPGTQASFGALIRAWADNGGACPPS